MIRLAGRRKWLAGFLAIVIAFLVLFVTVRWNVNWEVPVLDGSTTTVVPGIHLLGDLGPAAAYAVETSEGLVLIDSGLDDDAGPLIAQMAKLKLDWKRLRAILLTHVHGDHCGGAEHLRGATGAKIYAGQADAPVLRAGGPRDAFFGTFKMPDHTPHPTTVDVALEGQETITFGDVRVRIVAAPGHTPGSICYLVEKSGLRVLFSGDVIFRLGERPLGTYTAYQAPRYRGDARSYIATLETLRALPVPDLVLPGHPRASRTPQSPRLTARDWEVLLDEGLRDMLQLVARYEADGANFLDGRPKRLLPNLYYLGNFSDHAVYVLIASGKLFLIDAPGGPGLSDFLRSRLEQLDLPAVDPTAILLTACSERETAGLSELVARSRAQVVVSPAGMDQIRQLCPSGTILVPPDELPSIGWFSVTPIALPGPGVALTAYLLKWDDKNVLFSGRIPAAIDRDSRDQLLADLARSTTDFRAYVASLQRFKGVRPDLWLPAVPTDNQNANIYDGFWNEVLEKSYRTVLERRSRR